MNLFSRTDQSFLGRWWWTVDRILLAMIIVLSIIGIMLVAAASPPVALRNGDSAHYFTIRHIIYLCPAIMAMIGLSMMTLQQIWRFSVVFLGFSILAMIAVLGVGVEVKGAQRWLDLGFFSLQPSEFIKPAFLVVSAWLLARQKEKPEFRGFLYSLLLFGAVVILLLSQPDVGMTILISLCFATMIVLAGLPFRWIVLLFVIGVGGIIGAYFGFDHFQSRIDRFINPESGDTYQIDRALAAFRNGGFAGTGAGQGTVKLHIPDAHADFIFAVAGEELGMVFTVFLVGLYGYILMRGYNRLMETDNIFVILACGGLLTMFGLQALINMGSSVHILPTKGMTLPFISYGGSSLLSSGVAMGIVLALTRRQGRSGIARSSLSIRPIGGEAK